MRVLSMGNERDSHRKRWNSGCFRVFRFQNRPNQKWAGSELLHTGANTLFKGFERAVYLFASYKQILSRMALSERRLVLQ